MAKSTKYIAQKTIVNLNGKNYEAGATVTGLNADQEKRLKELDAIATEKESTIEATENEGTPVDNAPTPTGDDNDADDSNPDK